MLSAGGRHIGGGPGGGEGRRLSAGGSMRTTLISGVKVAPRDNILSKERAGKVRFRPCLLSFAPVVGVEYFQDFSGGKGVFLGFCAGQKNTCGHPLKNSPPHVKKSVNFLTSLTSVCELP